jgi:hypothetical protein
VRLAHGDERDLARVAPGTARGGLDAAQHINGARAQIQSLWLRLNTHCCDSVVNSDDYNKRARTLATEPSEGV